jgi:hypothetical protein
MSSFAAVLGIFVCLGVIVLCVRIMFANRERGISNLPFAQNPRVAAEESPQVTAPVLTPCSYCRALRTVGERCVNCGAA